MKLRNSLLTQYLLIILLAIIILPVSLTVTSISFFTFFSEDLPQNIYQNGNDLEKNWHDLAETLGDGTDEFVIEQLNNFKAQYSEASMYWVNEEGETKYKLPDNLTVPSSWSPSETIDFMKTHRGQEVDPFTAVALIGEEKNEGFIVLQIPRSVMKPTGISLQEKYGYLIFVMVFVVLAIFIFISWIFFYKIRKRLLRLQTAMHNHEGEGIPDSISVYKKDEIGQLEMSFNDMIEKLESSRKREKEEEMLRRQLIANLSHDLRTPLTTIRGHAYRLNKETLSEEGKESLQLIDTKVSYLSQLIENLLSYTLLTSGKYPYQPQKTDIVRLVKTSFAAWYPVFENLDFQLNIDFPDGTFYWEIDSQWLERVLDNFYQNINRHAREGKYIGVRIDVEKQQILIEDHGPGMSGESSGKGAGIGLSIVSLMLKDMNLGWEINTGKNGTIIKIEKKF